jgi:O-antigen ligase
MLILLCGSLAKIIQQFQSSEFRRSKIVRAHFFFLLVWGIGSIVGLIRFGPVTTVFFQGFGILHGLIIFFLSVAIIQRVEDVRLIIHTIIICAAAKSFQGLYFWLFDIGRPGPEGAAIVFYDLSSCDLMILILLFAFYSWSVLEKPYKVLLIVSVLPAIVAFIFSYRRNLYLGVIIATAVTLLYRMKGFLNLLRRQWFRFVALVFVIGGCGYLVIPADSVDFVWGRFASSFEIVDQETKQTDASNAFRIIEAINVLDNFVQNPVFGAGFGGRYAISFSPEGMDLSFIEDVNNVVHNSYLGILYKVGLIGFATFVIAYGIIYRALLSRTLSEYGIVQVTFFLLIVVLVSNFFSPNVFFERAMSLPALLFGLCQAAISISTDRERAAPLNMFLDCADNRLHEHP